MPGKPPVGSIGIGSSEPWLMPLLARLLDWLSGRQNQTEDKWARAIQRLDLRPGDRLLLRTEASLTTETATKMREALEQKFPGHTVIVLGAGLDLTILGREE